MGGLLRRYHALLTESGFRPYVEDHEDIAFKFEGGSFVLRVHEDDPAFFHLIMPSIHRRGEGSADQAVASAANSVNLRVKAVKLAFRDDVPMIHAVVETVLPFEGGLEDAEQFQAVLLRALGALQAARRTFCEELESVK